MADSTNSLAGKTGLSSFTVYLAKDGGAENTVSPTINERGHGWYEVTPTTAHRDTLGENAWTFVAAGAVDYPMKETVVLYDGQLAAVGANTTAPDNSGIAAAKTAAESADGKLTAGRLSRIDFLPNVAAGVATGLAIVGSEMALSSAVLAALFSDTDTAALVDAIIARFETDLDGADVSVAAIAVAVRDAILNRLLAGNHDTAGSVGKFLQNLDVLLSTRATPAQVTAALDAISVTALRRFVTVDTTETTAAAGSVAKLAQGAGGGGGGSGDAEQATLLEVQDTAEGIAAMLAGLSEIAVRSPVDAAGDIQLVIGDDHLIAAGTEIEVSFTDVGGTILAAMEAGGAVTTWGAGSGRAGGQILGTPNVAAAVNASGVTTIPVEVSAVQLAAGDPLQVYEWQLKLTDAAAKVRTIADGALRLKYNRI